MQLYSTLCPPGCCRCCILNSSAPMPAATPKLCVLIEKSCLMSSCVISCQAAQLLLYGTIGWLMCCTQALQWGGCRSGGSCFCSTLGVMITL